MVSTVIAPVGQNATHLPHATHPPVERTESSMKSIAP
jgi:hypothetical protein